MRILSLCSLDTTAELALIDHGRCVGAHTFEPGHGLSEMLWEVLTTFLARHALGLADIDAFACVRGPGSFTGLRVALTAWNGLALALNKPIMGFTRDEMEASGLDSSLSAAVRAGLLAYPHLKDSDGQYRDPVLPEYGTAMRVG